MTSIFYMRLFSFFIHRLHINLIFWSQFFLTKVFKILNYQPLFFLGKGNCYSSKISTIRIQRRIHTCSVPQYGWAILARCQGTPRSLWFQGCLRRDQQHRRSHRQQSFCCRHLLEACKVNQYHYIELHRNSFWCGLYRNCWVNWWGSSPSFTA